MAEELNRLRKKRSANRNVLLGLTIKSKEYIDKEPGETTVTEVRARVQLVQEKKKLIAELNEQIIALIAEDKICDDIEETTVFDVKVHLNMSSVEEFLQKYQPDRKLNNAEAPKKRYYASGVKLPKIFIKRFTGEPTEWEQFSDTFQATIDAKSSLSDIEKFSYLKDYLGDAAEKCIEGITLPGNNYQKAFNLLEERYGNKQLIIAAHVNQILRLEKVTTGRNVQELRNLFEQIESHVRSLGSLNVKSEHYGPLLIPIILKQLPDDIKLQISRTLGRENWQIEEFMTTLKLEIAARESCNFMKAQSNTEAKEKRHITTEALMIGTKLLVCAFCSKDHYHDNAVSSRIPKKEKTSPGKIDCAINVLSEVIIFEIAATREIVFIVKRPITIQPFVTSTEEKRNQRIALDLRIMYQI